MECKGIYRGNPGILPTFPGTVVNLLTTDHLVPKCLVGCMVVMVIDMVVMVIDMVVMVTSVVILHSSLW